MAIIGGGPAGTSTAIALRNNTDASVAVIEKSGYESPRVGETIQPECRAVLEALGVWEAFLADNHMPSYGTSSCWGNDKIGYNDFIYSPYGRGWHLDRRRFDFTLASEALKRDVTLCNGAKITDHQRSGYGGTIS